MPTSPPSPATILDQAPIIRHNFTASLSPHGSPGTLWKVFVHSGRAAPEGRLRVSRRRIGCCNDCVWLALSGRARAAPMPVTGPRGRTLLLPAAFPGFCRTLLRMQNPLSKLSVPIVHITPKPLCAYPGFAATQRERKLCLVRSRLLREPFTMAGPQSAGDIGVCQLASVAVPSNTCQYARPTDL